MDKVGSCFLEWISPKAKATAWQEFELANLNVAVQLVNLKPKELPAGTKLNIQNPFKAVNISPSRIDLLDPVTGYKQV